MLLWSLRQVCVGQGLVGQVKVQRMFDERVEYLDECEWEQVASLCGGKSPSSSSCW